MNMPEIVFLFLPQTLLCCAAEASLWHSKSAGTAVVLWRV
jgi:hypothetical protein